MNENLTNTVTRATMNPSGKQFEVLPGQSLLEAGLSAGIALPFGCANGSCGDCRARITTGQVQRLKTHDYVLTQAEKLDGCCLLCSNTPLTDVDIEVIEANSVHDIAQQQLKAKLCRIEHAKEVNIVSFKFTRGKALRFLPGQHASVTLPNTETFSLPIASCPCNAQFVEFHLPANTSVHHPLHQFTEQLMNTATSRERITVTGPAGEFTLTSNTAKPKLFIAMGAQFGQLQGMVEQVLNSDLGTPCCLLWQATNTTPHYRANLCRSWHDAIDEFTFAPIAQGENILPSLPTAWHKLLSDTEVYLGKKDTQLIQQLIAAGADTANILHPG